MTRRLLIPFFCLSLILVSVVWFGASAESGLFLALTDSVVEPGNAISVYYSLPAPAVTELAVYNAAGERAAVLVEEEEENAGFHEALWDGTSFGTPLPGGAYTIRLTAGEATVSADVTLLGEEAPSEPQGTTDTKAPDGTPSSAAFYPTPALRSTHTPDHDPKGCYWCTPMDITDEEAVWAMLTAPIYTIKKDQKLQVVIREEPSDSSAGVGVVTGASMGVHVLENRSDGWSLIECYSASFFDSKVKAWNAFVTGYVKTSQLVKKTPNQEYGIVIDKLTQTLYLFKEGHLFTTLAVSTGEYNSRQPYNETRSGEFLLVSKVGNFRSDAMICRFALRFDGGDLLHEVPHVLNADGGLNYKATEYKLGNRASHGCIRVQRISSSEGVNMKWLYEHLAVGEKNGTRLVIWEDFQGRQLEEITGDPVLYYNPKSGSYYHTLENCPSVDKKYLPLTAFHYSELDTTPYSKLTPCFYCQPPRSLSKIRQINELHQTSSPGMVADYHH